VALAYVYHFSAEIKNGVLHGERETRGKAGWFELNGSIGADETAILHANALTGPEKYNFQYQGTGPVHAQAGRPYADEVAAQFIGRHGNSKRIGDRVGSSTSSKIDLRQMIASRGRIWHPAVGRAERGRSLTGVPTVGLMRMRRACPQEATGDRAQVP
jgi:hypothetical protein